MSTAKTSKKSWERQLKEPDCSFHAFNTYKDLGVERTVPKTARIIGKSEAHCYQMHNKWKWSDRSKAWDDEIQRQKNNAIIKASQQMAERHAKIAMGYQVTFASMAKITQEAIGLKESEIKDMDIEKLLPMFIKFANALDTITSVERKARGEATEITKTDITSNGNSIRVILPSVNENHKDDDGSDADVDSDTDDDYDDSEDLEADERI